jgi:hypothetical protein
MQGVWRRGETLTSPAAAAAAVLIKVILASSASSDIQFSLHSAGYQTAMGHTSSPLA